MAAQEERSPSPLDSEKMTWAVLLGRWIEFAKSARALSESEHDRRWRASVAPVISLQAVTFALSEIWELSDEERRLGLDRAELLIRRHSREIHEAWVGEPLPTRLVEIIGDASLALEAAQALGWEWSVAVDRLEMPDVRGLAEALASGGKARGMLAALPGTVLSRSAPALFICPPDADLRLAPVPGLVVGDEPTVPRQVYRQTDETGRVRRDLVAGLLRSLPPGRPLLVPMISEGRLCALPDDDAIECWRQVQVTTLGDRPTPLEEDLTSSEHSG